ncbi:hypothetical protein ACPV5R_06705 [Vibrio astriarenae]
MVITDGMKVDSIVKSSLFELTSDLLSEEVLSSLSKKPELLGLNELNELGITITFNPNELDLSLELALASRNTANIDFAQESPSSAYSKATKWSNQNAINLAAVTNNNNEETYNVELNGAFNFGGVEGLNGIYRGYIDHTQQDTLVYRGSSYLFWDKPDKPWRVSIGDIDTGYAGHLSSINIGGIGWSSSYNDLQPYKTLRTSASQTFELSQSAEVDIFINNLRVTNINLPPGRYSLNDLPLSNGANEIRLEIRYLSGETDVLFFSQFYNNELLKPGITEFGLSLGVESNFSQTEYSYDSDPILTGYFEHGLNENWTLGSNTLLHKEGQVLGISTINGNTFGNIGLRLSSAHYQNNLDFDNGWAFSIDYSHQVWGSNDYPNLRISLESRNEFSSTPWYEESYSTEESARIDYTWAIFDSLDWNISSSWISRDALRLDEISDNEITIDSYVNWRYNNFYIQAGAIHSKSDINKKETIAYLNLDYYLNFLNSGHRLSGSYNSRNNNYRAEISRNANDYVGEFGYSISGEHNDQNDRATARVNYNANRWRGELNGDWQKSDSGNSWRGRANLSSALTLSEEGWAIHRAPIGPQALVKVHPTLQGSTIEVGSTTNSSNNVEVRAYSTHSNIIRLSRAHDTNSINYHSPDAPIGYDLGTGQYHIRPGSLTTHIVEVGSDASRTIIGTLLYADGSPVSLYRGEVTIPSGDIKTLFTNKAGRFALEGMSSGTHTIKINNHIGEIHIPQDAPILIYLQEPLILSKEPEAI